MKIFIVLLSVFVLAACAEDEVKNQTPDEQKSELTLWQPHIQTTHAEAEKKQPVKNKIDVEEVERKLGLSPQYYKIGYHEKSFNPCLYGYQTKSCENQFFTIINFRVECRDSEGTIETNDYVLTPFALKPLHIKVGSQEDDSQTDNQGYGQIRFLAKSSARESRFILSSSPFLLALHAGDVKKIMVPSDWCGR